MIPGQYRLCSSPIQINEHRESIQLLVIHTGDRPIQVGSHYHFYEVNRCLTFNRAESFGMRLDIPAGTAIRFEPGEEKPVQLVALGGEKQVYGLNALSTGLANRHQYSEAQAKKLKQWLEAKTNE